MKSTISIEINAYEIKKKIDIFGLLSQIYIINAQFYRSFKEFVR